MSTSSSVNSFDRNFWLGASAVVVIIVGAISTYLFLNRPLSSPLTDSISSQLDYSPFVIPADSKAATTTNYEVAAGEEGDKVLSYTAEFAGTSVVISQYAQPPQFVDIPEYKERFLNNIVKQYGTVQTSNGVIYLGKQTKQNNKPLGLMLEKGLIIFMNPARELSNAEWRQLGDLLEIHRITQ